MDSPESLEEQAAQLEGEADTLEQAQRSIAGQGKLQQAKSLRDKANLLR